MFLIPSHIRWTALHLTCTKFDMLFAIRLQDYPHFLGHETIRLFAAGRVDTRHGRRSNRRSGYALMTESRGRLQLDCNVEHCVIRTDTSISELSSTLKVVQHIHCTLCDSGILLLLHFLYLSRPLLNVISRVDRYTRVSSKPLPPNLLVRHVFVLLLFDGECLFDDCFLLDNQILLRVR